MSRLIVILNLSAPGAAKFVNPAALSFKDGSSSAVTKSSWTLNPIRNDGSWLYWSNMRVSPWTCAKVPLRKYTPSPTEKEEPEAAESLINVFANGSSAAITVAP